MPAHALGVAKSCFSGVVGWTLDDYGAYSAAFSNEGVDGGSYKYNLTDSNANGGALIIFYSMKLESTQSKIENAGGSIVRPIYSFPGGRRFHFGDPNGNEYAVWSDVN